MKLTRFAATAILLATLAACGEDEVILPGERIDVRDTVDGLETRAEAENRAAPIRLAAPVNHGVWPTTNGSTRHRITHPALNWPLAPAWSAGIGAGEDRKHRITATPVAADGRIFTLDSRATVAAHGTDGARLWARDLTPASDRADDASGGAVTLAAGRLFVSTGFGDLFALDPASGATDWVQRLPAPITGPVTVAGDRLYAVSRDGRGWAIDVANGRIRWEITDAAAPAVVTGGASPVVSDRLVIFPFGTGDLVATLRNSGLRVWRAAVSGQRVGIARGGISDVTGDPVLQGNTLYAGNYSGQTAAHDATSGDRLWSAPDGAVGPVWPAGGSLFLVSDDSELVRLDARTGERIWGAALPDVVRGNRPTRRWKDVYAHYGPVLAGGRVVVASSDGLLRSFDPESGALLETVDLPGGATTAPIVVNGRLYVVSQRGQLHAFQ
ncbi:PQQ-binding-like beta-propeller repeat protein [Rhodovulum sp. YNF3179]|uniref:outer membrane protein assembly factor BamB family protein n=1 Tax=Rhodovulum sp. YNF3179 TaxID=3425127 RepID=UPI003D32CEA8